MASDGPHGDTRLPFPRGMSAAEFGTGEGPGTKSSAEGVKGPLWAQICFIVM